MRRLLSFFYSIIHLQPPNPPPFLLPFSINPSFGSTFSSMATNPKGPPPEESSDPDELLCSLSQPQPNPNPNHSPLLLQPRDDAGSRAERAWEHWEGLGAPRLIVAPMVDNSELPFRMLCRRYGAQAAYTPMLHARIFSENEKYRSMEFTTCKEDRPLFVQFCANDPGTLLEAAKVVEPYCDYVDINLGNGLNLYLTNVGLEATAALMLYSRILCPQRIARRGNYGAFLMDNMPLIRSLVEKLACNLQVPVSCKIRIFPDLQDTIAYARMLEEAGCSLLAVHGRTRDEKDGRKFRADWDAIREVKKSVRIPVLANGNIRHMEDVHNCLEQTGADGVLSAETLLENPAIFAGFRTAEWRDCGDCVESKNGEDGGLDQADLVEEYLKLCEQYPVPWRIVRSHVHKMLGDWFKVHPEVREEFNRQSKLTFEWLHDMVGKLRNLGGRVPLYANATSTGKATENGLPMSSS